MCEIKKDINNYLTDCVCLDFDLVELKDFSYVKNLKSKLYKKFDLYLTIRFGKHTTIIDDCSITFGISHGELIVKLNNATVPLRNIHLTNIFSPKIAKIIQKESTTEEQEDINLSVSPGLTSREKTISKRSESITIEDYQVKTKGVDQQISWIFEAKDNQSHILDGMMRNTKMSTLDIAEKYFDFDIEFIAPNPEKNIIITELYLQGRDIISNKKKKEAIKKKIAFLMLEGTMKISKGNIKYV